MFFTRALWYYLFLAPHALQGVLVFVMVRRALVRKFPAFFVYTCAEVLLLPFLFLVQQTYGTSSAPYFRCFAAGMGASTVLRFGIIYEVFTGVFGLYPALQMLAKAAFRWIAVFLLLASAVLAFVAQGNGGERAMVVLDVMDRTVSIMQCGLVVALFVFSSYLAISWRNHFFGIALGLGIFASVELATAALRTEFALSGNHLLDLFTMGTYHICVLLWIYYLVVPERIESRVSALPEHDLETWNQELQRLLRQ